MWACACKIQAGMLHRKRRHTTIYSFNPLLPSRPSVTLALVQVPRVPGAPLYHGRRVVPGRPKASGPAPEEPREVGHYLLRLIHSSCSNVTLPFAPLLARWLDRRLTVAKGWHYVGAEESHKQTEAAILREHGVRVRPPHSRPLHSVGKHSTLHKCLLRSPMH